MEVLHSPKKEPSVSTNLEDMRSGGPQIQFGHFGKRKSLASDETKIQFITCPVGRSSSVGTATGCGPIGPGIEPPLGRDFRTRLDRPWVPPASYTMDIGSFSGVKRPGRCIDHPPQSSAEVKGRVALYLYSPSVPTLPVLGRTLPLPLPARSIVTTLAKPCRSPYTCTLYTVAYIHLTFDVNVLPLV